MLGELRYTSDTKTLGILIKTSRSRVEILLLRLERLWTIQQISITAVYPKNRGNERWWMNCWRMQILEGKNPNTGVDIWRVIAKQITKWVFEMFLRSYATKTQQKVLQTERNKGT